MTTPSASTALPAHVQICEAISRSILSGQLLDGAKLLPERAMAEHYTVSVGTLRKALSLLEEQGLLERIQGSGNYVKYNPKVRTIYSLFRLESVHGGGLPTAEILAIDRLQKPANAPPFGPAKTAHRFRRLRFLDGVPVALEEIWLDSARAPEIPKETVSDSLYFFYEHSLNLRVSHCTDRVSIAPVPDWSDPRFEPKQGAVSGYIERVTVDQSQEPFEFSRTWFDAARATYISRLK